MFLRFIHSIYLCNNQKHKITKTNFIKKLFFLNSQRKHTILVYCFSKCVLLLNTMNLTLHLLFYIYIFLNKNIYFYLILFFAVKKDTQTLCESNRYICIQMNDERRLNLLHSALVCPPLYFAFVKHGWFLS